MADFHTDYDKAPWRKVPIEELTTPKPGKIVRCGRWWAITKDGFALFYKSSPQCNPDKAVIEHIRPDCTPQWLEITYQDHDCSNCV